MCNNSIVKYELKGFISVKFTDLDSVPSFLVTPDQAYLSPCKQYAVGFGASKAELYKLKEGKLRLSVSKPEADWVTHLVNIALQQKPVLIHINKDEQIVGFTFPAN